MVNISVDINLLYHVETKVFFNNVALLTIVLSNNRRTKIASKKRDTTEQINGIQKFILDICTCFDKQPQMMYLHV